MHLKVLPDVLRALVEATEAAAQPVGEIDKITVIGGSSDTNDALGLFQGIAPATLARVTAVLADNGIDVTNLLKGFGGHDDQTVEPTAASDVEEQEPTL